MFLTPDTRVQLVDSQSSSVLGDETIVIHYEVGNYYELNEVGGFIWSLLRVQTAMSVQEIQQTILSEYDIDEPVCQTETVQFLTELLREKLIRTTA